MYIQYEGVVLEHDSRTYSFHVIDPPEKSRNFTVSVQANTFGPSQLKIQDGPGISMARLKRELERETPQCPAGASLCLAESDIQEYVARTYPKPLKKWGIGSQS
jgi:hypothetical protein